MSDPRLIHDLMARIVEQKIADPNADIRQTVWTELQAANNDMPAMLVDALSLLDTLGTFVGLLFETTDPGGALRLAQHLIDDIRFAGIVGHVDSRSDA